jgi:RNA polymerase sigma-70 factor (ECF subfamily)
LIQVVLAGAVAQSVAMAGRDDPSSPVAVDRPRLERMFAAHHEAVWRALRRRGLTEEEAEDATQETFLIAAGRLQDIRQDREHAFLVATARRVAYTLNRKTVRWQLDENMDQRVSHGRNASDERADVELCDMALSRLTSELAEVFVLYEIEGLSSPEIASMLEIPLGSVASRLRRAREQFRAAVALIESNAVLRRGR